MKSATCLKLWVPTLLAFQRSFCVKIPPWLMRDPAERDPDVLDDALLHTQRGGDGDQREGIGEPVPDLEIGVTGTEVAAWG